MDAHNYARLNYGYHYYAPSHLVRLVPDALLQVWNWAAAGHRSRPVATTPRGLPSHGPAAPAPADPAAPQV
ncbi:hypothetical protein GXW82_04805 [Streptacidiphilus sp. 4-A2]|nr:hypothetical protein [Streptacidiphilus sp. 4-A2]